MWCSNPFKPTYKSIATDTFASGIPSSVASLVNWKGTTGISEGTLLALSKEGNTCVASHLSLLNFFNLPLVRARGRFFYRFWTWLLSCNTTRVGGVTRCFVLLKSKSAGIDSSGATVCGLNVLLLANRYDRVGRQQEVLAIAVRLWGCSVLANILGLHQNKKVCCGGLYNG